MLRHLAMATYCLAIYLVLDLVYSALLHDQGRSPRIPDPAYHHTLAPNFDGYDNWGDTRFKVLTDSLGFRDGRVRDVAMTSGLRRVLLMGDSFTEGLGVNFEDSFAGMLSAAGLSRPDQIEFVDAGVISYSPVLYYRKTKSLLERGLHFDELVVFSDISDVRDEATGYFCNDEDAGYRKYCQEGQPFYAQRDDLGSAIARHFVMTDSIRLMIKFRLQQRSGDQKRLKLAPTSETAWLFPGADASDYAPLGVEGGVTRSLANMQKLADLLKQNGIPLTIVVYPWPALLAAYDPDNRQVTMWRDFCARNACKRFIDLFPAFAAEKEAHADWYERLFIFGDFHFSAAGNRLMFRELARQLL